MKKRIDLHKAFICETDGKKGAVVLKIIIFESFRIYYVKIN